MLSLSGSESTLLAGQQRFLERRISHLPLWPSFTTDPCHGYARTKTPFAVKHNEESLLHSECSGIFPRPTAFLAACVASLSVSQPGRDRLSPSCSVRVRLLLWSVFNARHSRVLLCLTGFWYLSWTEANSNWEQIAAFVGPRGHGGHSSG